MDRHRAAGLVYWSVAAVLAVIGFIDLAGIGWPFFLTGVAMLAVGLRRHEPAVLWPALAGVWAFLVAYLLIAPLGCTSYASAPVIRGSSSAMEAGHTSCTNLVGLDYSGGPGYQPSLLPALLAGLALGVVVTLVVRWVLSRRGPVRTA